MMDSANSAGERTRRRERHAPGLGGNAVRQMNVPPPFAVIHFQNNAGIAGGMVAGGFQDDVIRPHLRNRDGNPVEQQLHFYNGGMSAATGLEKHV